MEQPLVTIIIPVFNGETHLNQCLKTVCEQTYTNLEILIVDDGSTDTSFRIGKKFADGDARVQVIHQDNRGVSAARNHALERATGTYVTFVDGDDWLETNHIETLVSTILETQADCSICGYWLEYSNHREERNFPHLNVLSATEALEALLSPVLFQGFLCNKLFRIDIVRDNHLRLDETIFYYEDFLFCAQYFSNVRRSNCSPLATYHYRQHVLGETNDAASFSKWMIRRMTAVEALEKAKILLEKTPRLEKLLIARKRMECASLLRYAVVDGSDADLMKQLKRLTRKNSCTVLAAPVGMKNKIKYSSMVLVPRIASAFWLRRENKFL